MAIVDTTLAHRPLRRHEGFHLHLSVGSEVNALLPAPARAISIPSSMASGAVTSTFTQNLLLPSAASARCHARRSWCGGAVRTAADVPVQCPQLRPCQVGQRGGPQQQVHEPDLPILEGGKSRVFEGLQGGAADLLRRESG